MRISRSQPGERYCCILVVHYFLHSEATSYSIRGREENWEILRGGDGYGTTVGLGAVQNRE